MNPTLKEESDRLIDELSQYEWNTRWFELPEALRTKITQLNDKCSEIRQEGGFLDGLEVASRQLSEMCGKDDTTVEHLKITIRGCYFLIDWVS